MKIIIYVRKYDLEELKSYQGGNHCIEYGEEPSVERVGVLVEYDTYMMLEDGKGL